MHVLNWNLWLWRSWTRCTPAWNMSPPWSKCSQTNIKPKLTKGQSQRLFLQGRLGTYAAPDHTTIDGWYIPVIVLLFNSLHPASPLVPTMRLEGLIWLHINTNLRAQYCFNGLCSGGSSRLKYRELWRAVEPRFYSRDLIKFRSWHVGR